MKFRIRTMFERVLLASLAPHQGLRARTRWDALRGARAQGDAGFPAKLPLVLPLNSAGSGPHGVIFYFCYR